MKRSTLFAQHQALGARFTTVGEWELPQDFGDPQGEYQAIRQGAGLCDLSNCGLIRMTGKDRQRFLHAMVSNDTASLQVGQGCYATFLTAKGHLVTDMVVYAIEDAYLLELEPEVAPTFLETLAFYIISEDIVLHDESGQWGVLTVQGARAADWLTTALSHDISGLPPYGSVVSRCAGHDVRILQRSFTGEPGYLLIMPPAALPDVWHMLWSHREVYQARAIGLASLEVARIEAGIPRYGRDMTDATIPVEANLQAAISYTKGCYIGQEVIARIDARGHVNRQLVGLLLEDTTLPESGEKLYSPQREVGWITSTTYSPARQQNIALGYVRREVTAPGTPLEIRSNGRTCRATVTALPFFPPACTV